jgi:hypothetical protein
VHRSAFLLLMISGWMGLGGPSHAAMSPAQTVDAAGLQASNGTYICVTAVGQGCPVGATASSGHLLYSGFLHSFVMFTNLDHDADGLVDENDPDDDSDGLADATELRGSSFDPATATDPMNADSDGDGALDRAEAVAGTDPLDSTRRFFIVDLAYTNEATTIVWLGREGRRYEVLLATNAETIRTDASILDTVTAVNGSGPWQETLASYTHDTNMDSRIYRLKIKEN